MVTATAGDGNFTKVGHNGVESYPFDDCRRIPSCAPSMDEIFACCHRRRDSRSACASCFAAAFLAVFPVGVSKTSVTMCAAAAARREMDGEVHAGILALCSSQLST